MHSTKQQKLHIVIEANSGIPVLLKRIEIKNKLIREKRRLEKRCIQKMMRLEFLKSK